MGYFFQFVARSLFASPSLASRTPLRSRPRRSQSPAHPPHLAGPQDVGAQKHRGEL